MQYQQTVFYSQQEDFMTEMEKELKQAKHRLEEAQARERVKMRKLRTRRLIQEGAVLEKILPKVAYMNIDDLEGYLRGAIRNEILYEDYY